MAIPKVFISSTYYDLKYIRENLKLFIKNIGYESVLSEDGDVYYNTDIHTHDACLSEVSTCQMLVLIIGGRYGGKYLSEDTSITNMEYREAVKLKLPIFTCVEQSVYTEHHVYTKNKEIDSIDATKIIYPSVDKVKIFDFIDEVRKSSINNAIFPFVDYADIERYLKKQWAGMMYQFLTTQSESKRVAQLKGLPWCSGIFQNRSIAADTSSEITPLTTLESGFKGDDSLILGNHFVASCSGHWVLNCTSGDTSISSSGELQSYIIKIGLSSIRTQMFGTSNSRIIPSVIWTGRLEKDEKLHLEYKSVSRSQSSIGCPMFEFYMSNKDEK